MTLLQTTVEVNDWTPPMTTGKYLTLGEAAKETGIQKSTLSKALKSGKVSYVGKTSAGYQIDPAELFRVYPRKPQETDVATVENERLDTLKKPQENNALQVEVKMLREMLEGKDELLTELRQERDDWKGQAKTLLIANQNASESANKPRGGLFGLFSRKG